MSGFGPGKPSEPIDNHAAIFNLDIPLLQDLQDMGPQSLAEMPPEKIGAGGLDKIQTDHIVMANRGLIPDILQHRLVRRHE
jgi:hypothetical protein